MSQSERFSSPAWTCFRAELRRRWRAKSIARAIGLLLLIAGLEFVTIWSGRWVARGLRVWPGAIWVYQLIELLSGIGLYGPLTYAFALGRAWTSPMMLFIMQGIVILPWLACHFLMPAFAASSIAPDREQRRIPELILAGMTPRQILLAKGLAAVLPFLVVGGATLIATGILVLCQPGSNIASPPMGFSPAAITLSFGAVMAVGLVLSAATLTCISALSRRTQRAILVCYTVECLLLPILRLVSQWAWTWAYFYDPGAWSPAARWVGVLQSAPLTVLLLQCAALLVLWPRADFALAYSDEAV